MLKNPLLPWIAAGLLLIVAVTGWVRFGQMRTRAERAESTLAAREKLRQAGAGLEPAFFQGYSDGVLTYTVPHEVQRDGQTFVDFLEQQMSMSPTVVLYGVSGTPKEAALSTLSKGLELRIATSISPETGRPQIDELYVLQ